MSALTITLIVIGCVVLLLVFAIIGTYNGLVGCRNSADEAFSTMDVYLKKEMGFNSKFGGNRKRLCKA